MLQRHPAEDVPRSVSQAGEHPRGPGLGTEEQERAVQSHCNVSNACHLSSDSVAKHELAVSMATNKHPCLVEMVVTGNHLTSRLANAINDPASAATLTPAG